MTGRRLYTVMAGVFLLCTRTEAVSTGSEMKAAGRSLRRRAATTRRWRDDHGDGEGRDTDVRTRDSVDDPVETEAIPPRPPPSVPALVCSRIYRYVTHDETPRTDGSESDGLLSPLYGQRLPNAGELVSFNSIAVGPSSVTADTLFGPCSDHCDVLCSEMLNEGGGVKELCSVFSCNEEDNSCSAVTKCPPSLPDNPDGYCNPETGECGREEIGLVSSGPINRPDSGVDLISTATTASSCNQDFFLPIDMAKEKHKLKRAKKKWRLASAKRGYSYQVSEKSSPFYRSTRKKAKIVAVFREINQIFKKVGEGPYYNFAISYNRKLGYPKMVQLGYISSEGPRCVDIDLRIKRLRFSRPVDPCDPINQRTFDVDEALADLSANQLKFNDLQDYAYTISRNCFCPEEFRGPFNVTVLGGEISAATYEETAQAVDLADHSIPTIVELFGLINDACTTPTAGLSVVYSAEMGYPEQLYIDQNECIADEETSYTISGFREIPKDNNPGFLVKEEVDSRDGCRNPKPNFSITDALADLNTNQLKFNDLQAYDYTLSRSCFCVAARNGPVIVSVHDGAISNDTYKNTGLPVDLTANEPSTIPKLFGFIKGAIDKPYAELSFTYNVELGYPERIVYNLNNCISDAGGAYTVSNLVNRTPKAAGPGGNGGPIVPGGPGGPGLTFKRPLDEARENQVKWDAFLASSGSKSYIFTYREDSLIEHDQIITVLGGTPEKVSALKGFLRVPTNIQNNRSVDSIEGAFILLVETLKVGQGVTPLIQYDPKQGNPTSVSLSFISGERGGERISFTISDIKLLPTDDGCLGDKSFNTNCPNEGLSCYEEAGCYVKNRTASSICECRNGEWSCGYFDICMAKPDENRTEPHC